MLRISGFATISQGGPGVYIVHKNPDPTTILLHWEIDSWTGRYHILTRTFNIQPRLQRDKFDFIISVRYSATEIIVSFTFAKGVPLAQLSTKKLKTENWEPETEFPSGKFSHGPEGAEVVP